MVRSLRWRLTGWYVLVLAGVLLLFSVGTYVAARAALLENFDDVLGDQATLIAQAIDAVRSHSADAELPAIEVGGIHNLIAAHQHTFDSHRSSVK